MSVKLYVGNLSFDTTNQHLSALFAQVGTVTSCNIIVDRDTGRSRGFGFVEMTSHADSENAIAQLNGREIDGRELKVNEAKPIGNRDGSRSSGFGGGKSGFGSGRW